MLAVFKDNARAVGSGEYLNQSAAWRDKNLIPTRCRLFDHNTVSRGHVADVRNAAAVIRYHHAVVRREGELRDGI